MIFKFPGSKKKKKKTEDITHELEHYYSRLITKKLWDHKIFQLEICWN